MIHLNLNKIEPCVIYKYGVLINIYIHTGGYIIQVRTCIMSQNNIHIRIMSSTHKEHTRLSMYGLVQKTKVIELARIERVYVCT